MRIFLFTVASLVFFNAAGQSTPTEEVKAVLHQYKSSLESLSLQGVDTFFLEDSQIIESGKVEGTYQDYLEHHIGPELHEFKSFSFENYQVNVTVSGEYAYAVETYNYIIILKKDTAEIKRKGVATSILKLVDGTWKIAHMHNSSRKI